MTPDLAPFLTARGCHLPAIGLLQPATPFLDTAGEDLRRRIFVTEGPRGEELCLRPEFTIPVCLHHIAGGHGARRYGYQGPVFRHRAAEAPEFAQAGLEDLGEPDRLAADLRAIHDCVEALARLGLAAPRLTLGDQDVFEAVTLALGLPEGWRRRLVRGFGDPARLAADLARLAAPDRGDRGLPASVQEALASGDRAALEADIAARLAEGGLSPSAGRSPKEIAARLVEQEELSTARLDAGGRRALDAVLAFEAPMEGAADGFAALLSAHGLSADAALEALARRAEGLAGLAAPARFVARFGRRLDYYNGLVFEAHREGLERPVAGGGRYDRLPGLLGAPGPVPAVGFSIWLDRAAA